MQVTNGRFHDQGACIAVLSAFVFVLIIVCFCQTKFILQVKHNDQTAQSTMVCFDWNNNPTNDNNMTNIKECHKVSFNRET